MAYNKNYAPDGMDEKELRLFTALWPDDLARRQLALHRDAQRWGSGAHPVLEANLHVTLIFLGQMSGSMLPILVDRLATVSSLSVELTFDRTEDWGGGLVVLCPQQVPAALTHLHEQLHAVQQALGFAPESRPYRPHITLARRAHGAVLTQPATPIRWFSKGFVLAQSDPPGSYRILQSFC